MNERQKIDCAKEEDRKGARSNSCTERLHRPLGPRKRGSSNAYTHFVEYWKEGK